MGVEPTEAKVSRIRADVHAWVGEIGGDDVNAILQKAVRAEAFKLIDSPAGASVSAPFSEPITKSALIGYSDIWKVEEQDGKGWMIIRS